MRDLFEHAPLSVGESEGVSPEKSSEQTELGRWGLGVEVEVRDGVGDPALAVAQAAPAQGDEKL